jgi:hypothetical protein
VPPTAKIQREYSEDARLAQAMAEQIQAEDLVHQSEVELDAHLAETLLRQAEEQEQKIKESDCIECVMCLSEGLIMEHCCAMTACSHIFCVECFSGYIKSKVDAKEVDGTRMTCPICRVPVEFEDIRDTLLVTKNDTETWQKYQTAKTERVLEGLVQGGSAVRCPGGNCNFTFFRGGAHHFECPTCSESFCLSCDAMDGSVGPPHPGMNCEGRREQLETEAAERQRLEEWRTENSQADERYLELRNREIAEGISRPCPRCNYLSTRYTGCDHLDCANPTCRAKWCWKCGKANAAGTSYPCSAFCSNAARTWY